MPKSKFLDAQGRFPGFPTAYWVASGAALYLGDACECLRRMPARSVHCVVTSPPYWGLRDYGTAEWDGGDVGCDHIDHRKPHSTRPPNRGRCQKCGARRVDAQLGAEPSPDCGTGGQAQCGACFVCSMVGVFREVYRVLRDDGVVWLNLGDTYGDPSNGGNRSGLAGSTLGGSKTYGRGADAERHPRARCLPPGNLVGVPWRVALALQADGWVLRSDVPWVKRSAMPESVENRPCKSLEYIFMLAKGDGYYFDMDAVRRTSLTPPGAGGACFGRVMDGPGSAAAGSHSRRYDRPGYADRSFRNSDLWFASVDSPHGAVGVGDELVGVDVAPKSERGPRKRHYAVFPPTLITPLILSATSEFGCCAECGRPWERVAARVTEATRPPENGSRAEWDLAGGPLTGTNAGLREGHRERSTRTLGWRQVCGCRCGEVSPAIVLDPFVGSGTTVATAISLGRAGVGIDLSEKYLREDAVPRIEAAIRGDGITRRPTVAVLAELPPVPRRLR